MKHHILLLIFILPLYLGGYAQKAILVSDSIYIEQGKEYLVQSRDLLLNNHFLDATQQAITALSFFQKTKNATKEIADIYYLLGVSYKALGRLVQSEIYYLAALHKFQKLPSQSRNVYNVCNSLGGLYSINHPQKAIKYLEKAIGIPRQNNLLPYINLFLAYTRKRAKTASAKRENLQQALHYAKRALKILDSLDYKESLTYRHRASIFHNMGVVFLKKIKTDSATLYFNKSLYSLNQVNSPRHSLYYYNHIKLGELYHQQGQWQTAAGHFKQALKYIRQTKNTLAHFQALSGKAKALSQHSQANTQSFKTILPYFYQCDSLIRHLQKNRSYYDQLSFANETASTYETAFETCFKLYQQTQKAIYIHQAFYFMERAKGQVLWLERLKVHNGLKEAQNRVLLDSLANLRRAIAETQTDSLKLALYATMAEVSQQIEKPTYGLDTLQSIADIQQKIKSLNTTIISYFEASGILYGLVITKNRLALKQLGRTEDLNKLVNDFDTCVRNELTCSYNNLIKKGYLIYTKILHPLKSILPSKGQLIIIPEQNLWTIPFDALSPSSQMNYQVLSSNHLLHKYAIGYNYSVNLWASELPSHLPKTYPQSFAGIAPGFKNQVCQRLNLRPLLYSLSEIDNVHHFYSKFGTTTLFKGAQATLNKALKILEQPIQLVQFSTHSNGGDLPYIQFMPLSDTDKYTSRLHLENIYQLRPKTQLIILSSCLSGNGQLHRTEGILGLSRGFTQVGVPQVLFSLWNIEENESATHLMNAFHRKISPYIERNRSVNYTKALQQAKIFAIQQSKQTATPFMWAGFSLITHYSNQ